jgi:hypothetical protein
MTLLAMYIVSRVSQSATDREPQNWSSMRVSSMEMGLLEGVGRCGASSHKESLWDKSSLDET